jgi:hypothetical protein
MTVLKTKDGRKNGEKIQFPDMEEIFNLKGVVTHGQNFPTIPLQLALREPDLKDGGDGEVRREL